MSDPEISLNFVVLASLASATLVLLLIILVLIFKISGRLGSLENRISRSGALNDSSPAVSDTAPSVAETSPGGPFEEFLAEDPDRLNLTKKEQFSAYRQWRQKKGLNWSNS